MRSPRFSVFTFAFCLSTFAFPEGAGIAFADSSYGAGRPAAIFGKALPREQVMVGGGKGMRFEMRTVMRLLSTLAMLLALVVVASSSAQAQGRHDRLGRHDNGLHRGWTMGRHRGWSHSNHYGVRRQETLGTTLRRDRRRDRRVLLRRAARDERFERNERVRRKERFGRDDRFERGDRVGFGVGRGMGRGHGRGRP